VSVMNDGLSIIAHDLRTPLTALKMAAGLLGERRRVEADADEEQLIACLRRNIARLESIADELAALAERERSLEVS